MSAISGKLHYSSWMKQGRTLCGRVITGNLRVTSDPGALTCVPCKTSPYLDGQLGSMTHTGL